MRKKYLIFIVAIFILCITGCSNTSSNIENYLNSGTVIDSKAKDFMPILEDLPEYENIEYRYKHKSALIFESDSVALIVSYDDNTFNLEKEKLDEHYTFLDKNIKTDYDGSKYSIPEYEFSINSYNFRVVDENHISNPDFPKSFGIIGVSEEKKSIAYLYFHDEDLDYIEEENEKNPMANFVKEHFQYKF